MMGTRAESSLNDQSSFETSTNSSGTLSSGSSVFKTCLPSMRIDASTLNSAAMNCPTLSTNGCAARVSISAGENDSERWLMACAVPTFLLSTTKSDFRNPSSAVSIGTTSR